jgi:hypothetical protein
MRTAPLLGATFIVIVALVLPLAPDTTASHGLSLIAFHAQPVSVVSPTDSWPPAYPMRSLVLLSV